MESFTPISPREDNLLLPQKDPIKKENSTITWIKDHKEHILIALFIISSICIVSSFTYMFLTPVALIPKIPFMTTVITSTLTLGISFTSFLFIDEPQEETPPTYTTEIDFDGFQLDFA